MTGYNYLGGSNATVGDYQIHGTATMAKPCSVALSLDYTWNDIIDPNYRYSSDPMKASMGRAISHGKAKDYTIKVKWHEDATLIRDPETKKEVTASGWPFETRKHSYRPPPPPPPPPPPIKWTFPIHVIA
ncbi:MAG TPA: hypothetical protein VHQ47_03245 [Phycisphaerae bacterium]|nr:hypothetical protein [Phycisphaerae bacterium]